MEITEKGGVTSESRDDITTTHDRGLCREITHETRQPLRALRLQELAQELAIRALEFEHLLHLPTLMH